jgi:HEAT repeat protein
LEADRPILCPNCQTSNPAEKRYCVSCGYHLQIDCAQCYTPNRIDATHCIHCGVNLEQARIRRQELEKVRRRTQQEREQALRAKEARQQQEKLQRIINSLKDPTNHEFATFQLNQLGNAAIMALIEALLNHSSPPVRYGSVKALGQICDEHKVKPLLRGRAAKALIAALNDSEPEVRFSAAEELGKFKGQLGQLAVEPLGAMLKDRHEGVRQQARRSLQKIGGSRAQQILAKSRGLMGWLKGG